MHAELLIRAVLLLDFAFNWALGWRYLLSRTFRRRVHDRWKRQARAATVVEVTFASIAFVALNGFLVLVGIWLYRGIVLPRLSR
jgi:hypothetical protein